MSMLNITGQVLHVFEKPAVKRGDETIDAKPQVQLLGEFYLPNGESRFDLVTLSTDTPKDFEQFKGQTVTVPVGAFSPSKGSVIYFIPKGSKPRAA
jgi:hypothetical protein